MKLKSHIIIAFSALLLVGCSTKKNSFTRRAFHNTTARYNGYFNAKEIMKANDLALREEHQDDYSEILPLFIYPSEDKSKNLYPDMDKIIEKTSEVIDRHSIYVKKEEHNRWIDDSYTLMGKARFYKYEHYVAIEIFEYLAKAYNKKPEKNAALIWLARCHMELNEMNKAESYLKLMEGGKAPPEKYNSEYNALYADYLIRKHQYDDAIAKLEEALKTTKKRIDKRRFNYVLAQLWLKKKEYAKASEVFTKVIKLRPRYDMMFNAQISRALSFDVGGEDNNDIKKMLNKMLKDAKNKEFLDQIYYALADIAFKEGNEPLGIEYLQKSAASSVNNPKQKALAYLRLGELYFDKPLYVPAQAYYDSCIAVLPETYKNYDNIFARSKALSNLVEKIKIVETQDSLQRMANDEGYRNQVIDELIQKEKDFEAEQALMAQYAGNDFDLSNTNSINTQSNGKWYFYNQTTLGFGFADFKKNWGDRKLEDNWRRINKQTTISFDEDFSTSTDSLSNDSIPENPKLTSEYYLKFLPLDEKKMNASHNQIIEALYAQGNIYREDFTDYPLATKAFETLLERYDTCRYRLPTWYNLYRISLLINDDVMKEKYRNLILNNYPESEYAQIIQDPTYNKVTRENRKRVDNYYSIVYEYYKDGKYSTVLTRCEKAKAIFADNHIKEKFDFIAALSIGHTSPIDTFKVVLQNIIDQYPGTDEATESQNILNLIKKGINIVEEPNSSGIVYNYNAEDKYTFVAVIPSSDKKTNNYKINISNFNTKYFSTKTLNVNSIFLNGLNQIITVKELENEKDAIDYLKTFKLNQDELTELNGKNYQYFFISTENFITFYKDKNILTYLNYFNNQYELD
ncbi:tetratricopeptide repeat protein [Vicingus serpentipes]|uniref:Tetratricopeptide repeat protein n=1 Tax=Vicingus serpentipes TaxID=1926625 RepID=A0A5C6RQP0_9FLAO|nr:tetratricopeptide repeat protein [Vicingus serpentipes]TXB64329.1 tetratricopeptide repeat protein [Vicingus serpentipes]